MNLCQVGKKPPPFYLDRTPVRMKVTQRFCDCYWIHSEIAFGPQVFSIGTTIALPLFLIANHLEMQ
jgi:hypothetical protein